MAVVRHVFTTAADGDFAIDAEPAGLADRRRAVAPGAWTWLRQVHGAEVVVVEEPGQHAGVEADAAVTAVPGAVLAVQTADCAPVLLRGDGPTGPVIGAAHAGWRGLYAGVVENTVAEMQELGATDLIAHLGPCISPGAYEFGADELTRMALRFGPDVVGATVDGSPALDVRAAVRVVLDVLGVTLTADTTPCTALDPGYFSWRARGDRARMASVTWIEPDR